MTVSWSGLKIKRDSQSTDTEQNTVAKDLGSLKNSLFFLNHPSEIQLV